MMKQNLEVGAGLVPAPTMYDLWFCSRAIDGRVPNLLNDAAVVGYKQQINCEELVPFALEPVFDAATHSYLVFVARRAMVNQIARRMNPWAEHEIAHHYLI